ncbi:MAG TPA: zinc metalloprotease [Frankiaceae bacterium]|nr:zinc metalloprotease [Frankiaceae bacterium]
MTAKHRISRLTVVAMTSVTFTVAPAVGLMACVPASAEVGDHGRREPSLGQTATDLPASAKGKAGQKFAATIPVYFHVVTDGATGAVTDEQIAAQLDVLNRTFAGREGGDRTGFSFTLAEVTRTDNAGWFYASAGGNNEHSMKKALRRGGTNALNFYSTTAGAYLGWAYLPDILTKPGQAYLDGVVVDWESMVGTSTRYAGRYDQGETATHEVGHWLNLEHTFYGACTPKGDFVEDTPSERTATSGCPIGKDTCPAPGDDPIHNYMDYSYDTCYTQFTPGQTQRMRDAWLLYRA